VSVLLPDFSGLEVCRQITQDNPHVKVIVITALIDDAIKDEAWRPARQASSTSLPEMS